jgi:flagellar FliL protein
MDKESAETYEVARKTKRSFRPLLLIGVVLGSIAVGGAAGALGVLTRALDLMRGHEAAAIQAPPVFYALPEFRVVVGNAGDGEPRFSAVFGRQLRAVVQLEVEAAQVSQVDTLQPRVVDALLAFLHTLDQRDIGSARSLDRLKAQILHRVRAVTGDEAVRGVLITEFALL